jgi:hypothetical protein
MGKRPILGAFCFGCAVLLSSSSWAASLEPGQGDLSVNQGQGFQPVNSRVDAKVGDSVMVGPGGAATLTYDDGCTVTVQPGSVTTIAPISPCASGSSADGTDWGPWIAGGLVITGGIIAGFAIANHSGSSSGPAPTSP